MGTPQGSVISPILANVFLHYVLDLWANQWRNRHARGPVIMVRYADDFVMGFQSRADAERFLRELHQRLEKFRLQLHPEKTRLIEFGRYSMAAIAKILGYRGHSSVGTAVARVETSAESLHRTLATLHKRITNG